MSERESLFSFLHRSMSLTVFQGWVVYSAFVLGFAIGLAYGLVW